MDALELEGRFGRDAAILVQAKGVMMNKSFFLLFFLAALFVVVGLLTVGISGVPGWILTALIGLLGGAAAASGRADTVMTLGVAAISAVIGLVSIYVALRVVLGLA